MRSDKPPFNDIRLRRAVAMAIDHQAIIKTLWDGQAEQVPGLPKSTSYALSPQDFPPEVRRYLEYRPDEAKKLLAEAGYTPESPLDVLITVTPQYPSPYMEQAEAILSMLNKIGIRARLNTLEYGAFLEQVARRQTYPAGMAISRATYSTPGAPFALINFHSTWGGSANRSIVRDPQMDKLIEAWSATPVETERQRLAREIQIRAVDQAYRVPLPVPVETVILQPWVKNFFGKAYLRHLGGILEKTWIDK